MNQDDRTYVIEPDATDPDLLRNIVPLGESPELEPPRNHKRRRRVRRESAPPLVATTPRRPTLCLAAAYAAGPLAILLDPDLRHRRHALLAAAVPVVLAGAAVLAWARWTGGDGDRGLLVQLGLTVLAGLAWLSVWTAGLVRTSRRCGDGPLARRGNRHPFLAGLAGLAAPGLGLILTGRIWWAILTLTLVGGGLAGGLGLWRAPGWWWQHQAATGSLLTDIEFEYLVLALGGLVVVGLLAWLVSALEAGRVANGPVVVRRMAGADRVPALLLVALVALGVFFRPGSLAGELDRLTSRLVAANLKLIPLVTARAVTILAPGEPDYELHLARRYEGLGRANEAAVIRGRLAGRWRRYLATVPVADDEAAVAASLRAPATVTVTVPRPFATSQAANGRDRPQPAP